MANNKGSPEVVTSQYTAQTYGAKGTAGYGKLLEMITGRELPEVPKYAWAGPSKHFSGVLDSIPPVERFVVTFDEPAAKEFAQDLQDFYAPYGEPCSIGEMDLLVWLSQFLFTEKRQVPPERSRPMTFNQGAIVRTTKYSGRFREHSTSEFRQRSSSIRFIRVAREDRLLGCTIADPPHALPAATDLRGWRDTVYGLNLGCLPIPISHTATLSALTCCDPAARLCCIWLRVECTVGEDYYSRTVARHQWATGAYLELLDRVRLNRPKKNGYLHDAGALSNIRQYGYVICGRSVEVWVMEVEIHKDSPNQPDRRETICEGDHFVFPSTLLITFNLTIHQRVVQFSQWHQSIMTWGLNRYAQEYVETVEALYSAKTSPKDWLLGYADALGQELPQVVRDIFNETGNSHLFIPLIR